MYLDVADGIEALAVFSVGKDFWDRPPYIAEGFWLKSQPKKTKTQYVLRKSQKSLLIIDSVILPAII